MKRFLVGAPSTKKFGLANDRLNRQTSRPPSQEGARDQVMACADDEFLGMMKEDACLFLGHSESLLGDSGQLKSVGRTVYAREGGVHDGA